MRRIDVVRLANAAGLSLEAPFEPAFSCSNAVWVGRAVVLRLSHSRAAWTMRHEREVLDRLPVEIPHASVVATGRYGTLQWLALRRLPGYELGRLWPSLSDAHRRHRISQLAAAMRSLHRVPMPPKWQRPDLSKAALARRR
jgi:aminoglycoside phosphotransferase